jgi:hypothetical protein
MAENVVDQQARELTQPSSWGTLLLLGGMKRDAVPGMSINGRQASV